MCTTYCFGILHSTIMCNMCVIIMVKNKTLKFNDFHWVFCCLVLCCVGSTAWMCCVSPFAVVNVLSVFLCQAAVRVCVCACVQEFACSSQLLAARIPSSRALGLAHTLQTHSERLINWWLLLCQWNEAAGSWTPVTVTATPQRRSCRSLTAGMKISTRWFGDDSHVCVSALGRQLQPLAR